MSSIEIITASEKRRYWTRDEKRRLVAALEDPDANVSEVARAAGVSTSLLYRWRQQLAAPRKGPTFIPVAVAPATAGQSEAAITVTFGANVRLTIEGAPDAQTLSMVIGALSTPGRRG
jgi:transposase-like protein